MKKLIPSIALALLFTSCASHKRVREELRVLDLAGQYKNTQMEVLDIGCEGKTDLVRFDKEGDDMAKAMAFSLHPDFFTSDFSKGAFKGGQVMSASEEELSIEVFPGVRRTYAFKRVAPGKILVGGEEWTKTRVLACPSE